MANAADTFQAVPARANRVNDELVAGRGALSMECFSHRADATVFAGFGDHEMDWQRPGARLQWVGETFAGGHCDGEVLAWSGRLWPRLRRPGRAPSSREARPRSR